MKSPCLDCKCLGLNLGYSEYKTRVLLVFALITQCPLFTATLRMATISYKKSACTWISCDTSSAEDSDKRNAQYNKGKVIKKAVLSHRSSLLQLHINHNPHH